MESSAYRAAVEIFKKFYFSYLTAILDDNFLGHASTGMTAFLHLSDKFHALLYFPYKIINSHADTKNNVSIIKP